MRTSVSSSSRSSPVLTLKSSKEPESIVRLLHQIPPPNPLHPPRKPLSNPLHIDTLWIQHGENPARLSALDHVLTGMRATDLIESRESQRDFLGSLHMRKEVCERKRVLDGLPGSLTLERARGVSRVTHDADGAAIVFGDVGEVPDGPGGRVFEELVKN
jgi:hypothetical protein